MYGSLSLLDRLLPVLVLLAMIAGVLIGYWNEAQVRKAFSGTQWDGVSVGTSSIGFYRQAACALA